MQDRGAADGFEPLDGQPLLGISVFAVLGFPLDGLLTRLAQAARHDRYAPLRWRAASAAQNDATTLGDARAEPG